jgi:hypothetical protein
LLEAAEHDARVTVWEQTFVAMDARGDPRLTAWEEGFLCSMVEVARACRPLSGKQRDVLERIAAKVGSRFIGRARRADRGA